MSEDRNMLPKSKLDNVIKQLEELTNYKGSWERFEFLAGELKGSLKELEERSNKIESLLIVAIVGGTGVGKSTLINAIAGDKIAKTSEMRPCTNKPIIYHPPNWNPDLEFKEMCELYARSALDNIVLIDTPDTDTVIKEHRNFTKKMVEKCDLILLCGNEDKYLEEATWSIIREVNKERGFVLVETKISADKPSIMGDWLEKLKQNGIEPMAYFRVNALRALDRKLGIKSEGMDTDEYDFQKLEEFFARQLTDAKIRQIKTANVHGLIEKIIQKIDAFLDKTEPAVEELKEFMDRKRREWVAQNSLIIQRELKRETGTFYHLLKDEISLELHGIFLVIVQIRDSFKNMLAIISKVIRPWRLFKGTFTSEKEESTYFEKKISEMVRGIVIPISSKCISEIEKAQYELAFALDKAKIKKDTVPSISENFMLNFKNNGEHFLTEKIDYYLVKKSKYLANYFLIELFYVPMYAVFGYFLWQIIPGYFLGYYQGKNFIFHSCIVLIMSILGSFWLYDKLVYFSARRLRKKITEEFIQYLPEIMNPFVEHEKLVKEVEEQIQKIKNLKQDVEEMK